MAITLSFEGPEAKRRATATTADPIVTSPPRMWMALFRMVGVVAVGYAGDALKMTWVIVATMMTAMGVTRP